MFSYPVFSLLHGHREPHLGVFFREDLFFVFEVDLRVNLRGHNRTVAEQGLDIFDIDVVFQQEGGKGMAEDMRGDFLVDLGCLGKVSDEGIDWSESLLPRRLTKR